MNTAADNWFAILKLEAIGDNQRSMEQSAHAFIENLNLPKSQRAALDVRTPRPWVAVVTRWSGARPVERQFLRGKKDYSGANSVGSRGVCWIYSLAPGRVYEVHELVSWQSSRRYFCSVVRGDIEHMTAEEVTAWFAQQAK